eukprot:Hpha_TRINITY_DN16236_c1_g1::TRINITY_DN16236_c1_g1_i1::g.14635::m.14635
MLSIVISKEEAAAAAAEPQKATWGPAARAGGAAAAAAGVCAVATVGSEPLQQALAIAALTSPVAQTLLAVCVVFGVVVLGVRSVRGCSAPREIQYPMRPTIV